MSKKNLRSITIVSLIAMFAVFLSFAIASLSPARLTANAATYAPTAIFSAGIGGEVGTNRPETDASADTDYYVQFTFTDGGLVHYRRDLALRWFEAAEEGTESEWANPGQEKFFSMSFALPTLDFTSIELKFESAEENITKEGLSTNRLVFKKAETSGLDVAVRDSSYDEEDTDYKDVIHNIAYTQEQDITVSFASAATQNSGEFDICVKVGDGTAEKVGTFTNIGGYYLEYLSSSASTPRTPLTFEVDLPASGSEEEPNFKLLMKSLNGQTMKVGSDDRVEDDAVPVLVLSEAVYSFRLGQRFSLTYEAIDVCRDVITPERSYFMAKKDKDAEGNLTTWHKPAELNSKDYGTLRTTTYFMPTSDTGDKEAYVSIRFLLNDGTHSNYYVYLTWYAANDSVIQKLGDDSYTGGYVCSKCGKEFTAEEYAAMTDDETHTKPAEEGEEATTCDGKKKDIEDFRSNYFDYIKVDLEAEGPVYTDLTAVEPDAAAENGKGDNQIVNADENGKTARDKYQEAVTAAAEKVSAGDGAYFYLPSLRDLIKSDYADYRNLRFSIYYYRPQAQSGSSASSSTSLRYNNLRFEVDKLGEYRFRVIAQDAAGNAMKYYDEDGELVMLSSSNVWDIPNVPEFHFYIDYEGPSIEDAGEQTEGARERTYTITDFDIIALDGYEKEYTLYYFNESALAEGEARPEYSDFVKNIDTYVEQYRKSDDEKADGEAKILREIDKYNSELEEGTDRWDESDNKYAWNPDSSLSFVPPDRGYYIVQVQVTDAYLVNTTKTAYQVIYIRNQSDVIAGTSKWLENNIVPIVLFAISAVLGVAILVVWFVKPKEEQIAEVDLSTLKGSKEKNKKD